MASPLQFSTRTQKTIGLFDAAPVYEPLSGFAKPEGNTRCCDYSPCGRFFGYASSEAVTVVDASKGTQVLYLPIFNVFEIGFSPQGSYLITWERPSKDENGDANKNLKVWRTSEDGVAGEDKTPIGSFVQKQQGNWNLQYTADEKYCARLVTNEVQFHQSHDLITVWNKLREEGVASYALAPGTQNHAVAVFVPERKGQPAAVKVYNVPMFNGPISQKTFFKGDKVQMKWNKQGTSILVLAQTDVDRSGKSYYGETTLYLLSTNGAFDARVTLDKEGPIHDVSWSPNSREFGVVYGSTPSKATIFNHRAVAQHSFALAPRNTIKFSPSARFVLVAGFGNFTGQIDIYDMQKDYRKVCTIESGNPSVCEWSPDSRYLMTATTSPRLRVDNGVRLWHVGGTVMYNEDMIELYHVCWRPMAPEAVQGGDPLAPVPTPHATAAAYQSTVKTPSKPVGAYRPPGARGGATPLHFKREDEGGSAHTVGNGTPNIGPNGFGRTRRAVPGAEPMESPTPSRSVPGAEPVGDEGSKKNKKKRGKKGGQAQEGGQPEPSGGASLAPPREQNGANGARSPDRRGANGRTPRSQSRNNQGRSRSNTQQGGRYPQQQSAPAPAPAPAPAQVHESQDPNAKKVRSLQKKIRAIEDLEMRLAGGEKLEDTQMKKINTKESVIKELTGLGAEA